MKINDLMSDETLLSELGDRLSARRINLQLTQAEVAEQAGIGKRTLENLEAGNAVNLTSFLRVLRVLQALPELNTLLPEAGPRPMDMLKRSGKRRKRVSTRTRDKSEQAAPWQWEE